MILADTSAWIDFLAENGSTAAILLERAVRQSKLVMGDLVLVEILQGLRTRAQERQASAALSRLRQVTLCGPGLAPIAATNYRVLRRRGITIRGTVDVIIATWCIENAARLLHNDRDFDAMEEPLGLRVWR